MMLVLPPAERRAGTTAPPRRNSARPLTPCDALVERGVTLALAEIRGAAEEALVGATRLSPRTRQPGANWPGWRFSQSRWADAQVFALTAVRLAPRRCPRTGAARHQPVS